LNVLPLGHIAFHAHKAITLARTELDGIPILPTPPNLPALPKMML
jgi:hypothetical protein